MERFSDFNKITVNLQDKKHTEVGLLVAGGKESPASAGDMGSAPSRGRPHMARGATAPGVPQLLSLCSSPGRAAAEARVSEPMPCHQRSHCSEHPPLCRKARSEDTAQPKIRMNK